MTHVLCVPFFSGERKKSKDKPYSSSFAVFFLLLDPLIDLDRSDTIHDGILRLAVSRAFRDDALAAGLIHAGNAGVADTGDPVLQVRRRQITFGDVFLLAVVSDRLPYLVHAFNGRLGHDTLGVVHGTGNNARLVQLECVEYSAHTAHDGGIHRAAGAVTNVVSPKTDSIGIAEDIASVYQRDYRVCMVVLIEADENAAVSDSGKFLNLDDSTALQSLHILAVDASVAGSGAVGSANFAVYAVSPPIWSSTGSPETARSGSS